jgi:hypothetical protein
MTYRRLSLRAKSFRGVGSVLRRFGLRHQPVTPSAQQLSDTHVSFGSLDMIHV